MENVLDKYVTFPSDDVDRLGFPKYGGATDGTHVPIILLHGDYLNRKLYYSLIMQAICDHKYIFRNINIGWPGKVHDARICTNSEIFHKRENGLPVPISLIPEKTPSVKIDCVMWFTHD